MCKFENNFTSRQDAVSVQILPDVNIALHDGVVAVLVDSRDFHSQEGWLEERFRSPEPFVAYSDHLTRSRNVVFA